MKSVTSFYIRKIIEERERFKSEKGPLIRALQRDNNYIVDGTSGVCNDYAGDDIYAINKENNILHKYSDRLLILLTTKCVMYCGYCFRQINLENTVGNENLEELISKAIDYANKNPEIKEIILSGGDPVILGGENLKYIFKRIYDETKVRNIRLHSRSIVYQPDLFTEELIDALSKYKVRLVFHIIHPYEICDVVKAKIQQINQRSIVCYNQFPLLRNVNDNIEVIANLLNILDELHIRNLSIFMPDPLIMLEEYRISVKRMVDIYSQLETKFPAWISATRFLFDSEHGKINIKKLIRIDKEKHEAVFLHNEKEVIYPDLPEKLDKPGELKYMLWKQY